MLQRCLDYVRVEVGIKFVRSTCRASLLSGSRRKVQNFARARFPRYVQYRGASQAYVIEFKIDPLLDILVAVRVRAHTLARHSARDDVRMRRNGTTSNPSRAPTGGHGRAAQWRAHEGDGKPSLRRVHPQRNGFILKAWKSAISHVNPVHPVTDEHSAAAMIVLVECEDYDEGTKTTMYCCGRLGVRRPQGYLVCSIVAKLVPI